MGLKSAPITAVILISGRGTNLQSIIDAVDAGQLPIHLGAVISNEPKAAGLALAAGAGLPTNCVNHRSFASREEFGVELARSIDSYDPGLVILAGFMRVLSSKLVTHYEGRMLNIHPSLLPRFPGLNTHQRAIEAGDQEHGASVHFVTPTLDSGPIIVQAKVPVLAQDTVESLAARVLEQEHRLYPLAISWMASGRLALLNGQLVFDNRALTNPKVLDQDCTWPEVNA